MNTCVLFKCHKQDEVTLTHLEKLRKESPYDVFAIYDATHKDGMSGAAWNFTLADYLESGYTLASQEQLSELPSLPPDSQLIYYNPEIANLLFWKMTNTYDFYWAIEYDVWFNGCWSEFFDICDRSASDLLCTYSQRFPGQPFFPNLFYTYNFDVPDEMKRGMFGAVTRYSRKLMETLDREYTAGKHAFYEAIVPTIAEMNELIVTDINSIANFFQYRTEKYFSGEFYHPSVFCGSPIYENWKYMYKSTAWKNYLFHPVRELFYKENG